MSYNLCKEHLEQAEMIVDEFLSDNKTDSLDIPRFWDEQEQSKDNPMNNPIQMPLGVLMSNECIFSELDISEDWHRLIHDDNWRISLCRKYNDKSEKKVGRRLLNEEVQPCKAFELQIKKLYDIFEAKNTWHEGSYWLAQSADSPAELELLLDRVENRLKDLRAYILPSNWLEIKKSLTEAGHEIPLYRSQRGPVTFATSIYGTENLIYLILDHPDLAIRFRDVMLQAMLEMGRIIDEEAGYSPETAPRGFYFCDDNCALLNPEMYELFGYPILKGIFDRYSPDPKDLRGQHSDSAMSHLLPILGKLDMNAVNFGPTLTVREIREHLPNAIIRGQLAPFTLSKDEKINVIAELLRDFEMSSEHKGVIFATAGSINNGSRLSTLKLIMYAIQKYCRY